MNILIAADGSTYTARAVKHIASHFDWFKDAPSLYLLHVEEPIPAGRSRAFLEESLIQKYYEEESKAALAKAEKILDKQGISYQSDYKVGDVAEEIRAYAKKNRIDMIVMGSHGHGALQNLVMGSTATKMLAVTTVPVLIIR